MATNGNSEHDFVERCGNCDRFWDDWTAWSYLRERLEEEGFDYDGGEHFIESIRRKALYIDNVRQED